MKKILATCYLLFAICTLTACTFQTKHRGYIFPEDLDSILVAAKTTEVLEDKLGSPATRTIYGRQVWIYYGTDENYRGPLPLTYDNKRVLLVWVDGEKITATRMLTDEDLPDVTVDGAATPIPAEIRLNAFQEMINNVGRFTPAGLGQ